jgi:hypothetical protein
MNNFDNMTSYFINDGSFKDEDDFVIFIKDTANQRDFYNACKIDYLKSCDNLENFRVDYYLDSININYRLTKMSNEKNIKTNLDLISELERGIFSNKDIGYGIMLLFIIFYPIRVFLYSLRWAIIVLRTNKKN